MRSLFFLTFLFVFCTYSIGQSIVSKSLIGNRIRSVSIERDTVLFITERGVFEQIKDSILHRSDKIKGSDCFFYKVNQSKKYIVTAQSLTIVDTLHSQVTINLEEIPSNSFVNDLKIDKEGNIYISCFYGLIYKFSLQKDTKLAYSKVIYRNKEMNINELHFDEQSNRMYVATQSGVFYFDTKSSQIEMKRYDLFKEVCFSIEFDDSYIYFAGSSTVSRFPRMGYGKIKSIELCEDQAIKKIFFLNNDLWYVSDSLVGILDFTKINQKYSPLKAESITSHYATCVTVDKGANKVFVGTEGKGAFLFTKENLTYQSSCFTCDSIQRAGGDFPEIDRKKFYLGKGREFILHWDMLKVPDQIQVYEGPKFQKKIFDSKKVSGKGKSPNIVLNSEIALVLLISNKKEKTEWKYWIDCLNE
ncbi:MAG: hypothetical protein WCR52_23705 [Bacteroidota bacterium]